MSAAQHSGKAWMAWNKQINRARDAFLDNYRNTHNGNPIGSMEAWYGSAQYQNLLRQEPGARRS